MKCNFEAFQNQDILLRLAQLNVRGIYFLLVVPCRVLRHYDLTWLVSEFILGQFTRGGRVGDCAGLGFFPSLPAALLPGTVGHHYIFLASCHPGPGATGEHNCPWSLSSSKAFLKEEVWLPCKGSAAFLPLSWPIGWFQTWLVFPQRAVLPLRVKCFKTDSGFFVLRAWKICTGPLM